MRLSSESLVKAKTHRGWRVAEASLDAFADLMATRWLVEKACLTRAIAAGKAEWQAEIVAAKHRPSRSPLT